MRPLGLLPIAAALGVLLMLILLMSSASVLSGLESTSQTDPGSADGVSARALREIPPDYLSLYRSAARRFGLDWAILAGIGKVECDHGRDPDPSCTREGSVNSAGAGGPAQFLASTWSRYGLDGDGDGIADRWDPADAILSMANLLHAAGALADYRSAIFAYNHAWWYVDEVEHWAALYRGSDIPSDEADLDEEESEAGSTTGRAVLAPGDGHRALIAANAPAVVRAMIQAGNELQDLPYGPDGHPDPRGAPDEDCSSTLNYVLYRAGVRPISEILRDNPLAQSYVNWGLPGRGRWVSIYATTEPTDHVFVVIAGLRLDTSHDGTDVGPNRDQNGPRWRIFSGIPGWAHWTVRHPPGL